MITKIMPAVITAGALKADYTLVDQSGYLTQISLYPDTGTDAATAVTLKKGNVPIYDAVSRAANLAKLAQNDMSPDPTGRTDNIYDLVLDADDTLNFFYPRSGKSNFLSDLMPPRGSTRDENRLLDFQQLTRLLSGQLTDVQQAQWLVRSLLVFSAMAVERAYVYFFNDEDQASLHASAGLTRHFKPKPSFYAVSHPQKTLGDYRFERIVTDKPGKLRVHEYRNGNNPKQLIWAVWYPSSGSAGESTPLADVPGRLVSSTIMPLTESPAAAGTARQIQPGVVEVTVAGSPEYLRLEL